MSSLALPQLVIALSLFGQVQDGPFPPHRVIGSPNVNPGYVLADNKEYPEIADDFAKTFKTLKSLPCDIFLGAHGAYYAMPAKYERLKAGAKENPFVDPTGYKEYVDFKEHSFRKLLDEQK